MDFKNFEIHIVHYELLKERRTYLEKRLKDFGLEKFCFWHIDRKVQQPELLSFPVQIPVGLKIQNKAHSQGLLQMN